MAEKPKRHRVRMYWLDAGRTPGEKKERPKSAARYHTSRWIRASRAFRAAHPLCAECLKKGIYTPSQVVDHIIPIAICADFWDESNWQALCKRCNMIKGNKDKKYIQGRAKR